jgi:ribose 5-phosphate isomerase B
MTIFIAADHRGFELKNKLIKWLKSQKYQVIDCGNTIYDPTDDYPDYISEVTKRLLATEAVAEEALGIVICGSGVGVCIAANRFKGIRCALGFDVHQIKHGCENDHINVLALPADYINLTTAKRFIKTFLTTKPVMKEKYLRRIRKTESNL